MLRRPHFACAVVVIAAGVLAACGGGGGGGANGPIPNNPGGPPPVTSTPTATPTPTPTPVPTPFAQGDKLSYQGTQETRAVFFYPSPSPYPSKDTSTIVNQNIVVTGTPYPNGPAPFAGDFHSIETDASALATHTVTSDTWIGQNGAQLLEYGAVATDDSGDSVSTQYTPAYNLNATAANTAGSKIIEQYADGTSTTRTYNADGSYNESGTISPGVPETVAENSDGSGSFASDGLLSGAITGFTYSAPSPSGITITATFAAPPTPTPNPSGKPSPTPNPQPTPRVYTVPAWYGPKPILYAESVSAFVSTAYPAQCSVPSSYGTSGASIAHTVQRVDTIFGYTETLSTTSYESGNIPVCVMMQDTQTAYYDYQDDYASASGFHLHFVGVPLSTTTISQTLTLQSGAVIQSHARSALSGRSAITPQAIVLAQSAFLQRVYRQRHVRERALMRALQAAAKGGQ